jgi:hypothetical protein
MSEATYWEIISDQIKADGWSVGWTRYLDTTGEAAGLWMWQADAHKDDGRQFIARAEELAVAFCELQKMTRELHEHP